MYSLMYLLHTRSLIRHGNSPDTVAFSRFVKSSIRCVHVYAHTYVYIHVYIDNIGSDGNWREERYIFLRAEGFVRAVKFLSFFFQDLKSIDAVLIRILPCAYARYARREHNETRGDPVRNAESALFNHPVKASNA